MMEGVRIRRRGLGDDKVHMVLSDRLEVLHVGNRKMRTPRKWANFRRIEEPFSPSWRERTVRKARAVAETLAGKERFAQFGNPHVSRWRQYGGLFWRVTWFRSCFGYGHVDERCYVQWREHDDDLESVAIFFASPADMPPDKPIEQARAHDLAVKFIIEIKDFVLTTENLPRNMRIKVKPIESRLVYALPNRNFSESVELTGRSRLVYAVRVLVRPAERRFWGVVTDGYPFPRWVLVDAENGEIMGGKEQLRAGILD